MGQKDWPFLRERRQHHPVLKLRRRKLEEIVTGDKDCPCTPICQGPPAAPSESQATRRGTSGSDYDDGRQGLAISLQPPAAPSGSQATRRETRGHCDGRQRLAFSLAASSGSQVARRETRADCDGRQDLAIPAQQHHPVPRLQEERQESVTIYKVQQLISAEGRGRDSCIRGRVRGRTCFVPCARKVAEARKTHKACTT